MNWSPPLKPAEITEKRLIDAILENEFGIGSHLPAERELAGRLGVTRPTLREALQRLARDGWVDIQQGKPTRVRNYWEEGNLGVLSVLASRPERIPADFVINLLQVRLLIAPAYTRLAVQKAPHIVLNALAGFDALDENPQAYAQFDWHLHHRLTIASGNPIFTLILNGFGELYGPMAQIYFQAKRARALSLQFYTQLSAASTQGDPQGAEQNTRNVMQESIRLWAIAERAQAIHTPG